MISAGRFRRAIHPLLLKLWLKHVKDKERSSEIGGFTLTIRPTVFHPRFFGSSKIFAEYLVSTGLAGKRFLDMGTGSGLIGLFAARAGALVTAVDINPNAVECARVNAERAGLVLDCRQSDLFAALQGMRFDVIAWNPPFFAKRIHSLTEAAFHSGDDHAVVRRFAHQVGSFRTAEGRVFLILSADLDLLQWKSIFAEAGLGFLIRENRRWGARVDGFD